MNIVRFTTELSQYGSKLKSLQRAKDFIKSEYTNATDAEKEAIQAFNPSIVAPFESVEAFVNSLEVVEDVEADSNPS
jgi:hypothetical protein